MCFRVAIYLRRRRAWVFIDTVCCHFHRFLLFHVPDGEKTGKRGIGERKKKIEHEMCNVWRKWQRKLLGESVFESETKDIFRIVTILMELKVQERIINLGLVPPILTVSQSEREKKKRDSYNYFSTVIAKMLWHIRKHKKGRLYGWP